MMRPWRLLAAAGLTAAALLSGTSASSASTRYDPRLRFQTISTPRFDIHFHQGEETLAQRLAPDAVILLKGSRGMRLERLVAPISQWAGQSHATPVRH